MKLYRKRAFYGLLKAFIYKKLMIFYVRKLSKIFEPYFTTKHKSGGTGMGLYISKLIIQSSFKGDIKVKAVDNGVKFILEIPKGKEF